MRGRHGPPGRLREGRGGRDCCGHPVGRRWGCSHSVMRPGESRQSFYVERDRRMVRQRKAGGRPVVGDQRRSEICRPVPRGTGMPVAQGHPANVLEVGVVDPVGEEKTGPRCHRGHPRAGIGWELVYEFCLVLECCFIEQAEPVVAEQAGHRSDVLGCPSSSYNLMSDSPDHRLCCRNRFRPSCRRQSTC
jgi:hypothetical protein